MPTRDLEKRRQQQRRYYEKNKRAWLDKTAAARRERMEWLLNTKRDVPCADCGKSFHPAAMDYDHLPGEEKVGNVSALAYSMRPMEIVLEEIAKCEIVCSNCHRVRTFNRARLIEPAPLV